MKSIFLLIVLTAISCTRRQDPPARVSGIYLPDFNWKKSESLALLDKPVRLNGVNEFIPLGEKLNILSDVPGATLSAWIRAADLDKGAQYIISISVGNPEGGRTSSRASVGLLKGGRIQALGRSLDTVNDRYDATTTQPLIKKEKWHHIASVIDYAKNQIMIYVDGRRAATQTTQEKPVRFQIRSTARTLSLYGAVGSEDDGSDAFFEGEIQGVGVWGRVLSSEEIKNLSRRKPR